MSKLANLSTNPMNPMRTSQRSVTKNSFKEAGTLDVEVSTMLLNNHGYDGRLTQCKERRQNEAKEHRRNSSRQGVWSDAGSLDEISVAKRETDECSFAASPKSKSWFPNDIVMMGMQIRVAY